MTGRNTTSSCTTCGATLMVMGDDQGVRTVCSGCRAPEHLDTAAGATRWRTWLVAHGVTPLFFDLHGLVVAAVPQACALLWYHPAPESDQDLREVVLCGLRHRYDVVLLGGTLADMQVLADLRFYDDTGPVRRSMVRHVHQLDNPAIFGACDDCGQFQWHSQSGHWICRSCSHYDGNATLDATSIHHHGFDPTCVPCAALLVAGNRA